MSSELVCADLSGAHVTIVCMTASACSASPVPRCNCGISELMMFTLKCVSVCVCVCGLYVCIVRAGGREGGTRECPHG